MNLALHSRDLFDVFGLFYEEVRELALLFIFVFFVVALINEFLKGMEGKADYPGLFVRIFLLAGLFTIYTPFVREVTSGMDHLAEFFMPDEELKESMLKVFSSYKEDKDLGMVAFIKMTFLEWMIHGTFNLAYWVMRGFTWVRFIFLAALYLSGPILIGVGFFLPGIVKSWVRWLFEVSSWNVVLSLFVRILSELNFFETYAEAELSTLDLVAMNLIVIVMIILFVPMFSSMIIRGSGGFSGAAGAILGLGGALMMKQVANRAKDVRHHLAGRSFPKATGASGGGT